MAYSDFTTLTLVREAFGLTIEESINLFSDIPEVLPQFSPPNDIKGECFFSNCGQYREGACRVNYCSGFIRS
jgi:hypothetical protein